MLLIADAIFDDKGEHEIEEWKQHEDQGMTAGIRGHACESPGPAPCEWTATPRDQDATAIPLPERVALRVELRGHIAKRQHPHIIGQDGVQRTLELGRGHRVGRTEPVRVHGHGVGTAWAWRGHGVGMHMSEERCLGPSLCLCMCMCMACAYIACACTWPAPGLDIAAQHGVTLLLGVGLLLVGARLFLDHHDSKRAAAGRRQPELRGVGAGVGLHGGEEPRRGVELRLKADCVHLVRDRGLDACLVVAGADVADSGLKSCPANFLNVRVALCARPLVAGLLAALVGRGSSLLQGDQEVLAVAYLMLGKSQEAVEILDE